MLNPSKLWLVSPSLSFSTPIQEARLTLFYSVQQHGGWPRLKSQLPRLLRLGQVQMNSIQLCVWLYYLAIFFFFPLNWTNQLEYNSDKNNTPAVVTTSNTNVCAYQCLSIIGYPRSQPLIRISTFRCPQILISCNFQYNLTKPFCLFVSLVSPESIKDVNRTQ